MHVYWIYIPQKPQLQEGMLLISPSHKLMSPYTVCLSLPCHLLQGSPYRRSPGFLPPANALHFLFLKGRLRSMAGSLNRKPANTHHHTQGLDQKWMLPKQFYLNNRNPEFWWLKHSLRRLMQNTTESKNFSMPTQNFTITIAMSQTSTNSAVQPKWGMLKNDHNNVYQPALTGPRSTGGQ